MQGCTSKFQVMSMTNQTLIRTSRPASTSLPRASCPDRPDAQLPPRKYSAITTLGHCAGRHAQQTPKTPCKCCPANKLRQTVPPPTDGGLLQKARNIPAPRKHFPLPCFREPTSGNLKRPLCHPSSLTRHLFRASVSVSIKTQATLC